MRCEAPISNANQFFVEGALASAFLISSDKHDGASLGIECKGEAPKSVEPEPKAGTEAPSCSQKTNH
jgi:hypothetical protein